MANAQQILSRLNVALTAERDPGNGKAIAVRHWNATFPLVIAANTSEAATLARPKYLNQRVRFYAKTVGASGTRTLTVTTSSGSFTLIFAAVGDYAVLESVPVGSNSFDWRVAQSSGVTGTGIPDPTFDDVIVDTLTLETIAVVAEAAEHGAGAIGTGVAPVTYRHTENGIIITEIKVDLEGLASVATANDVIGLSAGGNAYIGRNVVAVNGIIFKIELICLETPAGGDNDVNVVANSSGTLAYDGAGGTAYGVNGGDAAAGQVVQNLVQGLTANHYFYLTAGTGDTAAAYTAGMFIVRLHGHQLLA